MLVHGSAVTPRRDDHGTPRSRAWRHRRRLPSLRHGYGETTMAIDEARRHGLHESARRALGADAGDTLMEMLPPVGWSDVATKRDLDAHADSTRREMAELRSSIDLRFETLEIRITSAINDAVRGSEHRILVWMFTTVLTAVLGGTAISVAVALAT